MARWAFRSAMFFVLLFGRTSRRKSAPCSARARATWLPTNPVAPVRKASIAALNVPYPIPDCDAIMYHMTKASVRDLRYRFHEVEDLLRQGQEIQITKRRRVIATLVPATNENRITLPDFEGRLRKIYGKRKLTVTGAELIARDRERL